ncbi:unnamed protein product [Ectocarpus sp. 12 AP-2014]
MVVVVVVVCEGGGSENRSRGNKHRRVRIWRDDVQQSCERQTCRNPSGTTTNGGGGMRSMDMCSGWVLSRLSGATQQSQDSSIITGQRLRSRARPSTTIASWRSQARRRPSNLFRDTTTTRCVSTISRTPG